MNALLPVQDLDHQNGYACFRFAGVDAAGRAWTCHYTAGPHEMVAGRLVVEVVRDLGERVEIRAPGRASAFIVPRDRLFTLDGRRGVDRAPAGR